MICKCLGTHFHSLQADDRNKAIEFVARYDEAIADPASRLKVHRVTHYLATGPLGLDLRAYASGNPMSERLPTEITAYQLCMLDDSMQESPHARISRVVQSARPAKPPWWSATIRLDQNLAILKFLDHIKPQRSRALFRSWKFLAQPNLSARIQWNLIPKKVDTKQFLQMVYRLGPENRRDWSELALINGRDRDSAIGPLRKLVDHHALCVDVCKRVCKPGLVFTVVRKHSALSALDTLGQGDAPRQSMPTPDTLVCFQILDFSPTCKRQVDTEQLSKERALALPAMVQHYIFTGPHQLPSDSIHVRPHNMAIVMDMMDIAGDVPFLSWLPNLRQWTLASGTSGNTGDCDIVEPILVMDKIWHYVVTYY